MVKFFLPTLFLFFSVSLQANDELENYIIINPSDENRVYEENIYVTDVDHIKIISINDIQNDTDIPLAMLSLHLENDYEKENALTSNFNPNDWHIEELDFNDSYTDGDYKDFGIKSHQDVSLDYGKKKEYYNWDQLLIAGAEIITSAVVVGTVIYIATEYYSNSTKKNRLGSSGVVPKLTLSSRILRPIGVGLQLVAGLGLGTYLILDGIVRIDYVIVDGNDDNAIPFSAIHDSIMKLLD